jgi:hypothetical protein
LLEQSTRESDVSSFPAESAKAGTLAGMCEFYAGDLQKAADRFLAASRTPAGASEAVRARAEEALWLAILALDKASQRTPGDTTLRGRLTETTLLYLSTYPDSQRAARLLLREGAGELVDQRKALEILMGVARESPVYEASRRQAARILYALFRQARGSEKDFAAMQFLGVADELLTLDKKAALAGTGAETTAAAQRVQQRVRQMLDALLSASSPDVVRAEGALETLRGVATYSGIDLEPIREELLFRRLQIAIARSASGSPGEDPNLLAGQLREAGAQRKTSAASATPGAANADQFLIAADRLMYKRALDAWRDDKSPGTPVDKARAVMTHGVRVVEGLGRAGEALRDPAALAVYSTVAEAAMLVWRETGKTDAEASALVFRLDDAILGTQPGAETSLLRVAEVADALGQIDRALECWKLLLAGREPGTPAWFEARYRSLELLSRKDPGAARGAMDQHRVLHPDFGPEPWGSQLRTLDGTLPAAPAPQPAEPSTSPGGSR